MNVVFGGAGFIGANLADHLLSRKARVRVVDSLARPGARMNAEWLKERHPHVEIVREDVRAGSRELERHVRSAEVVYHLAAQVAVTTSLAEPRLDFEVNALGTLNVLEAVRHASPDAVVVYASTNKVYGALDSIPIVELATRYAYSGGREGIDESQPLDFFTPYGCSKGAGDQYTRDYARVFGLRTVVLRQSCIYGPRQFGAEDQGWLAWFAIAAVLGARLTIFGSGKQVRDVLHVADLVDLIDRAVARAERESDQVYNVGGGPGLTLSLVEAISFLEDELDLTIRPSFEDARAGDQAVYVSDISRARNALGWSPRTQVDDGLRALVKWVGVNRALFSHLHAHPVP